MPRRALTSFQKPRVSEDVLSPASESSVVLSQDQSVGTCARRIQKKYVSKRIGAAANLQTLSLEVSSEVLPVQGSVRWDKARPVLLICNALSDNGAP